LPVQIYLTLGKYNKNCELKIIQLKYTQYVNSDEWNSSGYRNYYCTNNGNVSSFTRSKSV